MIDLVAVFLLIMGLELVLGIDNILVITILVEKVEASKQNLARMVGLVLAFLLRIVMLLVLLRITGIEKAVFYEFTVRDMVLLIGGMFLLWKAIREIHHTVEFIGEGEAQHSLKHRSFWGAIRDIVLLDAVFSLDSVITAIGLTENLYVIILAVMLSFVVILAFAKSIGDFILARPSLKILALSFLITIGVTLFLEGLHQHVPKGYIYLPMGFALMVELLQMRHEYNQGKKHIRR